MRDSSAAIMENGNGTEAGRAAAAEELRAAFAALESGGEPMRFVGGHGVQSRVFEFAWSDPALDISIRLIAQFSEWHDGISATNKFGVDPAALDTPSKLNADFRAALPEAKLGLEKFVFEDIASNPDFNLKETDAERAFGVENNPVSRHMLVGGNTAIVVTFANIPPPKRRVVFAAFNAFRQLAPSVEKRNEKRQVFLESNFLARVVKHLPKLESLMAARPLTSRDVLATCFPDIKNTGKSDADLLQDWENDISNRFENLDTGIRLGVQTVMETTGATFSEAKNAVVRGKKLPELPFISTAQYSLHQLGDIASAGIQTMESDIDRVSPYTTGRGDGEKNVFPLENQSWKFTFPDGERLETSGEKQADVPRVGEKIRKLCGEVHPKQIGTVAFLLSQGGTGGVMLNHPLAAYKINTTEHSPLDFTLSRNDETGAVTITYSSPKELPVRFSWTATVGVDGSVTSTPFTIEKPVAKLDARAAGALIDEAVAGLGIKLDDTRKNEAVSLLRQHGTNMFARNAKLVPEFKRLVPDPKKQKAISTWMNQLCFSTIIYPANHRAYKNGTAAHELPGGSMIANRDFGTGTFDVPLLDMEGHDLVHELQISPDGKTATITQTQKADLAAPGSRPRHKVSFGQVTLQQRVTIDLEAENPTITTLRSRRKSIEGIETLDVHVTFPRFACNLIEPIWRN